MGKEAQSGWTVEHDYKPYVIRDDAGIVASITGTAAARPDAAANASLIGAAKDLLAAVISLVERGTDSPVHMAAERAIARALTPYGVNGPTVVHDAAQPIEQSRVLRVV